MKKLQKPISILLSLIMILSIFTIIPLDAGAVSGVSYIERSWDGEKVTDTTKTSGESTVLSEGMDVNLSEGWYVLKENVTLTERLTVDSGTVNLILCDGATLTDNAGIGVGANATLNIYGQSEDSGKIAVTMAAANSSYAAIGGTDLSAGDINIHGGTMELTNNADSVSGAGIGGCASCSVQSVSIYGGDIKATASSGAGIGGGRKAAASNNSGKEGIRIYGGTVEAKSTSGVGIGNGNGYDGSPGTIAISGSTFKADGGTDSAGIGTGNEAKASPGSIEIRNNSDVTAKGGEYGAGISGGNVTSGVTPIFSLLKSFTLSWTELTDSIHFDKVNLINYSSFDDKIKVADGKAFIDDDGNIYKGILSEDQLRAMSGKTLTPYIAEYTITVADTVNGTVTSDLSTAEEGEKVTLTVTPDEKYVLYSLTVTDAEGNEVEAAEDHTFTMPASDVTVSAKFARTYILGDADGDGDVEVIDTTLIQRKTAGLKVKAYDEKAADVDGSGSSDIIDATLIQRYLARMKGQYKIGEAAVEEPA